MLPLTGIVYTSMVFENFIHLKIPNNLSCLFFNVLWQKRHFLPVSFNLAKDLYEEGKKEIVKRLSQKLLGVSNLELVETGTTDNLITSSDGQLEIYNSI